MPNRGVISPSASIEDKRADSAKGDMRYDAMRTKKRELGFTMIELLVAIVVLAIVAAIAIPGFSRWLPNYRLKSATRDIYSNMQLAKLGAVRANTSWVIDFNRGAGSYTIWSTGANRIWDGGTGDDEQVRPGVDPVDLSKYGSGVGYGHGNATTPIGSVWGDDITYATPADNVVLFNPRGTCSAGYVYLENEKDTTTYGIGTMSTGVIRLKKWSSSKAKWE